MRYLFRSTSKAKTLLAITCIMIMAICFAILSQVSISSPFKNMTAAAAAAPPKNVNIRGKERTNAQGQTPPRCSSCPPPIPRSIYVPAIELSEASTCEIVLNSRSANEIEVTPTFYTVTGEPILGEPLRLKPAEIRFARVDSLIPRSARHHHWGGMTLSFVGSILEVWAQITFHGVGGRGSIDETFNILGDQPSDTREAVWWLPKKGTAVIALGNSSNAPIQTTANFSDGEAKQITIAPFATEFIRRRSADRPDRSGSVDSVKLTVTGSSDAMRVAGFIVGGDKSFDSSIRFADTKKVAQPNLYATNLRLQNTEPHMVLKNTGLADISARPRFFSAAGENENPVELPAIVLRPNETVDVNLTPLMQAAAARPDLNAVSVNVVNSGAPGSLIGAWNGTDTIKLLTYDVPLRDSGPIRNSTGSYPWRTDQDYTTIVNITNVSDHAASFVADIRFPGGHYFVPTLELPAGGTARFDLRKMISEQRPDNQGNVIPLSTTGGQFHWSIFHSPPSSKFIGRSEVISVSRGVGSSYSCPGCCPDSGPFGTINPPPSVFLGESFTASTTGTIYDGCTGYATNVGWFAMEEFWMDDESIASYSPESGSSTLVTGLFPGQTALHGIYSWQSFTSDGWSICYEDRGQTEDQQPVDVQCKVPTGETSAADVWGTGNLATVHMWKQTLTGTGDFTNRTIAEQEGTPATISDACHFPGSMVDPYTVTGLDATVTAGNQWKPDAVGRSTGAVTYYRQQGRSPCSATASQVMFISCPDMLHQYTTGNLVVGITATEVSSKRHSASAQTKAWP